jgi:hypothetical protein
MTALTAYIGRDNEESIELLNGGSLVTAQAVTKVVFKFGSWVINTDDDPTLIYFTDPPNNQTVGMKLGKITGVTAGGYDDGKMTIFDTANTDGLSMEEVITVTIKAWPIV